MKIMKIIFDNSESAAPVAPLLLAKEEYAEELFDAMEAIEEAEENTEEEKPSGRGFGW
ncbi:MAG: hypothetical protein ACO3ZB_06275 [Candidatus Nanopelagicaceae bacterium]